MIYEYPCRLAGCGKVLFYVEYPDSVKPDMGDPFPSLDKIWLGKTLTHPMPGQDMKCQHCNRLPPHMPVTNFLTPSEFNPYEAYVNYLQLASLEEISDELSSRKISFLFACLDHNYYVTEENKFLSITAGGGPIELQKALLDSLRVRVLSEFKKAFDVCNDDDD